MSDYNVCIDCEIAPVDIHSGSDRCTDCYNSWCERVAERECEDGETFRGGEAAAFEAENQARIQRELK